MDSNTQLIFTEGAITSPAEGADHWTAGIDLTLPGAAKPHYNAIEVYGTNYLAALGLRTEVLRRLHAISIVHE